MTDDQYLDLLLVDDSRTARRFLEVSLKGVGYKVRVCSDGSEACWQIASNPPDFIISDWQMPNMNGAELCNWIRERFQSHYMYFILMTAHEDFFDVVDGLDAGADEYLEKPFKMDELLARLRCGQRVLKLERQLRAAAKAQHNRSAPSAAEKP